MKPSYIIILVGAVLIARLSIARRRRARKAAEAPAQDEAGGAGVSAPSPRRTWGGINGLGDVGIVASREIRERVRGRIFRIGTLVVLLAVAAAIVIPTLHKSGGGATTQTIGIVGGLSPQLKQVLDSAGSASTDVLKFVEEPSLADAKRALRAGTTDLAVVDGTAVLLNLPAQSSKSPADPVLVQDVAEYLGVVHAYQAAGLTPAQAAAVDNAKSAPVETLQSSSSSAVKATSVIGIVLLFIMLTQYCTWILIGVMQEKSSRVVEVLLATVRPIQLLAGKVLGIGLVALGQAALIVGFALALSAAVGSDLLHGTAPIALVAELLWLVLGYAFYCWVYAAAGSMAERQDQVQTLALPLSIPILLGYIFSITTASTGHADIFFKVLAYLPPTAPFCMSVLVGLDAVSWWEFLAAVLISIAGTAVTAFFAAGIYRRAVLRTGGRVHVRELFSGGAG